MEDLAMTQLLNIGAGGVLGTVVLLKLIFDHLRSRRGDDVDRVVLQKIVDNLEKQTDILLEIRGFHVQNTEGIKNLTHEIRELRGYVVRKA